MSDNINPAHYSQGWSNNAEVIDITENLSFNLGNVVKYVSRAGRKTDDSVEDLQKAEWYLSRELQRLNQMLKPKAAWTVEELQRTYGLPRVWKLIDEIPAHTIVRDADGDLWKRINGTARFMIAPQECWHETAEDLLWEEWHHATDPIEFGPYTEVLHL